MAEFPIPEGYYLLGPVNTKTAKQALAEAEENGFAPETVQTRSDGFLVPLPREEEEIDDDDDDDEQARIAEEAEAERLRLEEEEENQQHEISPEAAGDESSTPAGDVIDDEIEDDEEQEEAEDTEEESETEAEPRPDDSWLKPAIEDWAKAHDIDPTGTKAEILGRINTQEVK